MAMAHPACLSSVLLTVNVLYERILIGLIFGLLVEVIRMMSGLFSVRCLASAGSFYAV